MSLFYAYAKNIVDDTTSRYIIVFATRAVADEWWRAVSTSTNISFVQSIRRITPQFYTHDPKCANISQSITQSSVAGKFLGLVFFTLLPDRDGRSLPVIPVQNVKDHISGDWFYIRSKLDPSKFWYRSPENKIVASTTYKTRFRIRAADSVLTGEVMISSDDVFVTAEHTNSHVCITTSGSLITTGRPNRLKFKDLSNGFRVGRSSNVVRSPYGIPGDLRSGDDDGADGDGDKVDSTESDLASILCDTPEQENIIVRTTDGDGEDWEFV